MFLPPEQRPHDRPGRRHDGLSRRREAVLLGLVAVLLVCVLGGPVGGSTVAQAVLAIVAAVNR